MIFTYTQCLDIYSSNYQIDLAIKKGLLYRIEKGIYSDTPNVSTLAIITAKYPQAIITMESAFYFHGLTDVIPEKYWVATTKSAKSLKDNRIHQMFVNNDIFELGVTTIERNGEKVKIYDKERMLIELLRFKNKIPYDYYKEILLNYRNIIKDLDIERIQEYAQIFPKSKMITESLDREVF